jgi:hypothetical protein
MTEIGSSGAAAVFRCIDTVGQSRRYARPDPPHEVALQYLLEDVNDYVTELGGHVLVVADDVHSAERHRTNFRFFRRHGTPGYRSSTLDAVLDTIYFGPSSHSRLLQAADLLTYMYTRRKTVREADQRAQAVNDLIWERVQPMVRRDITSFSVDGDRT